MKKKLLTILCFLSVSIALVACGNSETTETDVPDTSLTPTSEPTGTTAPTATPIPTQSPTATPLPTEVPEPTPIPPCNPHKSTFVTVESTCVEHGSITRTCEVCGYVEVTELGLSNKHIAEDWIVEQEATESTAGIVYQTCTLCNADFNRNGYRLVDGEIQIFTWRQIAREKDYYFEDDYMNIAGQMYLGEDFSEVVQMMDDPTVTFHEEHFYDGTVFEGLTSKQIRYLAENGYTVHELVNEIVNTGTRNVFGYFESIGKPLD